MSEDHSKTAYVADSKEVDASLNFISNSYNGHTYAVVMSGGHLSFLDIQILQYFQSTVLS